MKDGHKVEGCGGRWIDIGTLHNPWLQKCSDCRATRQKPAEDGEIVDVKALAEAEERHMRGLARLKADLEEDAKIDPIHQDEDGFWFWDADMQERYGPYETRALAEQVWSQWLDDIVTRGDRRSRNLRWVAVAILVVAAIVTYLAV